MPNPQTIVDQLTLASNGAAVVAIAWHVVVAGAILGLLLGWRPSNRTAGVMLAGPIASAAGVALVFGNPFNGTILAALAVALVVLALRLSPRPVALGSPTARVVGALLVAFGAFYPHFLHHGTPLAYVYAAPTGVVPCPSLSLVIGFALLADGLGSRAWSLTAAALGLFYGIFGVARLAVYLDIPLVLGALALLIAGMARRHPAPAPRSVRPRATVAT